MVKSPKSENTEEFTENFMGSPEVFYFKIRIPNEINVITSEPKRYNEMT